MTNPEHNISIPEHNIIVHILGKSYSVKCPQNKAQQLQDASEYVDQKMREMRDSGKVIGTDRIAIITALNIAYELLNLKEDQNQDNKINEIANRIASIQERIKDSLTQKEQLDFEELS